MINITILPFMGFNAYQSGEHASDFQLDMLRHGLAGLNTVKVQQIPENPFLFNNCNKDEIRKIWGKGFTLYGLLDPPTSDFPVEDSDLIIIGLHHTGFPHKEQFYHSVKDMVDKFGKNKIVVVDGQDNTDYQEEIASLCKYFKRELTDDRTTARPISFGIPEEKFSWEKVDKKYDFSPMVPANFSWGDCGHLSTYIYQTEEEYYRQYEESFFAYSCKKGGWATGRGQEIIANNCIPYWTDIEVCPKNCLFQYPKELCIAAKKLKGVCPGTISPYDSSVDTYIGDTRQIKCGDKRGHIDWDVFSLTEYNALQSEIKTYAWKNLTTKSLAKYILEESL